MYTEPNGAKAKGGQRQRPSASGGRQGLELGEARDHAKASIKCQVSQKPPGLGLRQRAKCAAASGSGQAAAAGGGARILIQE